MHTAGGQIKVIFNMLSLTAIRDTPLGGGGRGIMLTLSVSCRDKKIANFHAVIL